MANVDKRGIYGQTESNAGVTNAANEFIADAEAEARIPGSMGDYVGRMAVHQNEVIRHASAASRLRKRGAMRGPVMANIAQRDSYHKIADITKEMKEDGYGVAMVYNAIEGSRGKAYAIRTAGAGATAKPAQDVGEAKTIKVRGGCSTYASAARNGSIEDRRKEAFPVPSRLDAKTSHRDCGKEDGGDDPSQRYIV